MSNKSQNNSKGTYFIIGAAVIFAIGIYLFLAGPNSFRFGALQNSGIKLQPGVASTSVGDVIVEEATSTEQDQAKNFIITVSKPVVNTFGYNDVSQKINQDINREIDNQISDFKATFSNATDSSSTSSFGNVPGAPNSTSTLDIRFNVVYKNAPQHILSISLNRESYFSNSAHPEHQVKSLNYDISNGNRISLGDLFTSGSTNHTYLNRLSDLSMKALADKLGESADVDTIKQGTLPSEDNFSVFFITGDGLRLVFNEYQVAAYYFGPQDITLPYSEFSDSYNPSGPLATFLNNQ